MSNEKKKTVSRRSLLKFATGGLAIAALPNLGGCAVETTHAGEPPAVGQVDEALLYAGATWVNAIMRRDDLVVLKLGFVNLEVKHEREQRPSRETKDALTGSLFLSRTKVGTPAYIIAVFQPQHIFEESFEEPPGTRRPESPNGSTKPVRSLIAQESRIAFVVPNDVNDLPYELDKLLTAMSGYQLNVAPGALSQSPAFTTREVVPVFSGLLGAIVDSSPRNSKRGLRAARQRKAMNAFAAANPEVVVKQPAKGVELGPSPIGVVPSTPTIAIPAKPRAPTDLQTSIELPFRLQISPNVHAHFEHAALPVKSPITQRVELWHSRLRTDEAWQKTIRAMWTRDHFDPNDHKKDLPPSDNPFPVAAMTAQDRADIVHVTTNYTLKDDGSPSKMRARAVDVSMLALSSLGGWLDSHGAWPEPSDVDEGRPGVVGWDHHAPMGRDQKVRIVRTGYLYPFGHKAVWVVVTERKFVKLRTGDYTDTAYLWTRNFVVVKEPLKTYDNIQASLQRGFPFKSVRFKTTTTPNLVREVLPGMTQSSWCAVANGAFPFELLAFDHDGNAHDFTAACMWIESGDAFKIKQGLVDVAEEYAKTTFNDNERRLIDMRGQRVAYADGDDMDDTRYTTRSLRLRATVSSSSIGVPWAPQLEEAALDIDSIRGLTGKSGPTSFSYWDRYLEKGFEFGPDTENAGHVFLTLPKGEAEAGLDFNKQSDRSGGFVAPSMAISALSRRQGLISGDPSAAGKLDFEPEKFFSKALSNGKLFGCISLFEIVDKVAGDAFSSQAPKFVTQSLETAEALISAVQGASDLISDPTAGVLKMLADISAALPAYQDKANPHVDPNHPSIVDLPAGAKAIYSRLWDRAQALGLEHGDLLGLVSSLTSALQGLAGAVGALATALDQISTVPPQDAVDAITNAIIDAMTKASAVATELAANALPIQDGARAALTELASKLDAMVPDVTALGALVTAFVAGYEALEALHIKLEWAPEISSGPAGLDIFVPNDKRGLKLGVDIRAKDSGGEKAGVQIYASLSDFELRLLGPEPFMKLFFDRLVFKAGSAGKPQVDCKFRGMKFDGALKFVETLKDLIPLDGFSDGGPHVDVDPTGLAAKFGLSIPDIAIGVFSLTNLSFSAGFGIPFTGKALEVKFAFCKREEPFSLTVCMLGGGGFVGITLTPAGMRLLEIALEAQAALEVNFGIASGGISVAVGIYLAIEEKNCTLTGYVRMRGEVDVLGGLVSASIELLLELTYESENDKVTGHAMLEIDVSILFIHINVSFEVTKKFKGNNGDPTLRELMEPFGNEVPWEQYCDAFAA